MSIARNARCSQILRDMENGKYVNNSKFRGYNPNNDVDRPSWDYRPRVVRAEVNAQRKVRTQGA